jgi:hypothetical protein
VRHIVIAAIAAVALAAAPAAAAKEITSVTVCGTDGCTTTKDHSLLDALMGGSPTDPPSHVGGAIRLRGVVTEPGGDVIGRVESWWVPHTSLIAAEDGSWIDLGPAAGATLQRVTGDLKAFPPGRIGAAYASPVTTPAAKPAPAAAGDGDGTSVDWVVVAIPLAAALAAAAALLFVRRRPGGATG